MTEDSVVNSEPISDFFAVYATAKDIACAMAYIHSKGIIHGDLQGDSLGLASSSADPRGFVAKVRSASRMFLYQPSVVFASKKPAHNQSPDLWQSTSQSECPRNVAHFFKMVSLIPLRWCSVYQSKARGCQILKS